MKIKKYISSKLAHFKQWILFVIIHRNLDEEPTPDLWIDRCMICGTTFKKPSLIFSGETLMCRKCADSRKYKVHGHNCYAKQHRILFGR